MNVRNIRGTNGTRKSGNSTCEWTPERNGAKGYHLADVEPWKNPLEYGSACHKTGEVKQFPVFSPEEEKNMGNNGEPGQLVGSGCCQMGDKS